ncbi:MAG: signal peptide peptidase SppA [Bacteroidota bacterium]|jgi:protease-4|nr:signal peptide peptidase SppA [Sphingobacteriales bacterium]
MKQFFKMLLASVLGVIISSFILILILVGIAASIASSAKDDEADISENSILQLNLSYDIPERTSDNPFGNFDPISMESKNPIGLHDIVKSIKYASTDDRIKGIYMKVDFSPASYGTLEEIRDALIEFKKSKKFIIAYGEMMEEHAYYVASVADKIYLNPSGELLIDGFSYNEYYLKGMLDKVGVQAQLIRHGKYKAAGEPFVAEKMSNENRQQIESFMGSMFTHFIAKIAEARKKSADEVRNIAEKLLVQGPADAKKYGMIDELKYEDEVDELLKKKSGVDKKIKLVSIDAYHKKVKEGKLTAKEKIAIVYANGEIISGEGSDDEAGSAKIAAAIKEARTDSSIKALVLRVNSPGGSVIASEVMWREVQLTRNVKPVIVSFGAVAASGGYYIATPANVIVAEPNTITGSIGVFGMLLNAEKLIKDKLGINVEKVKFGEFADLGSPDRPLTEAEKAIVQKMVDHTYVDFVNKVAKGRNLRYEQVDSIAEGRVWSGVDAKRIGLVDELGGLDKALAIAKQKAGIDEYRLIQLPEQKDPIETFFKSLSGEVSAYWLKQQLGTEYIYYKQLQQLKNKQGLQARLLMELEIK